MPAPSEVTSRTSLLHRLTALWALAESGLGGLLFALHIPATGLLLGAFSTVIISLLAYYAARPARSILQALVLVLLVKAAVSPHSPPPAYLAVGFQGLVGAALFGSGLPFRLAAVLLGGLALAESALQKVIVLTILFGKSLWQALDAAYASLVSEFHLPAGASATGWVLGAFVGGYGLWGLLVGAWAGRLPAVLGRRRHEIATRFAALPTAATPADFAPKARKKRWPALLLLLAGIMAVFLWQPGGLPRALYVVLRSIAAVLLLLYFIQPLLKALLTHWLSRRQPDEHRQAREIMALLPRLRGLVRPAWDLSAGRRLRLAAFVENLIILSVFQEDDA